MSTTETQSEFEFTPLPPSRAGEQMELDFTPKQEESVFTISEAMAIASTAILTLKPIRNVSFHGVDGKTVGLLDWSNGPMTFTGDAEESAQKFFECVIQRYDSWTGIPSRP